MKKRLILIGIILIITVGLLSLYRTFSLSEEIENNVLPSSGDYLLTYSLKENTNNITVGVNETKYVDIKLKNIYSSSVKYGVYYIMNEPKQIVSDLIVSIDDSTENKNEEILESNEEKILTIKLVNNSEYNISLTLGSVVGFEQGDINTLIDDNMILIK